MAIVCPMGQHDNDIQKIPAIMTTGREHITLAGPTMSTAFVGGKWGSTLGHATLSGSRTSDLAMLLTPPLPPKKPRTTSDFQAVFAGLIVSGAVLLLLFAGIQVIQSMKMGQYTLLEGLAIRVGPFALALGIPILFFWLIKTTRAQDKAKNAGHVADIAAWNAAIDKWNRSYYCFRHHLVFDPQTGESCDAGRMYEFLYSTIKQTP